MTTTVHAIAGLGTSPNRYFTLWTEHADATTQQIVLNEREARQAIARLAFAIDPEHPEATAREAIISEY
jgi:hypothetical protein